MQQSIRDRDRQKLGVRQEQRSFFPDGGGKKRRNRIQPAKGIPCRVKSPTGEYYDLDPTLNILEVNANNPDGHLFKSRSKAGARVYWTIRRYLDEGDVWEDKRYILENVT